MRKVESTVMVAARSETGKNETEWSEERNKEGWGRRGGGGSRSESRIGMQENEEEVRRTRNMMVRNHWSI